MFKIIKTHLLSDVERMVWPSQLLYLATIVFKGASVRGSYSIKLCLCVSKSEVTLVFIVDETSASNLQMLLKESFWSRFPECYQYDHNFFCSISFILQDYLWDIKAPAVSGM